MIDLPWYFWLIAYLTLSSGAHDFVTIARNASRDRPENVWLAPTIVGLLWCAHEILVACGALQ